jgi:hypothetical protein
MIRSVSLKRCFHDAIERRVATVCSLSLWERAVQCLGQLQSFFGIQTPAD